MDNGIEIYKVEVSGGKIKLPQNIIDQYGKKLVCLRPWIGGVLYYFNCERWNSIVENIETRIREEQNNQIRKGLLGFMKYWGNWAENIEVEDNSEISIYAFLLSEWVKLEGAESAIIVDGFQTQNKLFALMSDETYTSKKETICAANFNLFRFEAEKDGK